jgi:hypothetical protein
VPCPPINALLMAPLVESRDIPSGKGGTLEFSVTEKVYGGELPVATMVQPTYAPPWVPLGQVVVVIVKGPPDAVTVTVAVDVADPAALVAVSV